MGALHKTRKHSVDSGARKEVKSHSITSLGNIPSVLENHEIATSEDFLEYAQKYWGSNGAKLKQKIVSAKAVIEKEDDQNTKNSKCDTSVVLAGFNQFKASITSFPTAGFYGATTSWILIQLICDAATNGSIFGKNYFVLRIVFQSILVCAFTVVSILCILRCKKKIIRPKILEGDIIFTSPIVLLLVYTPLIHLEKETQTTILADYTTVLLFYILAGNLFILPTTQTCKYIIALLCIFSFIAKQVIYHESIYMLINCIAIIAAACIFVRASAHIETMNQFWFLDMLRRFKLLKSAEETVANSRPSFSTGIGKVLSKRYQTSPLSEMVLGSQAVETSIGKLQVTRKYFNDTGNQFAVVEIDNAIKALRSGWKHAMLPKSTSHLSSSHSSLGYAEFDADISFLEVTVGGGRFSTLGSDMHRPKLSSNRTQSDDLRLIHNNRKQSISTLLSMNSSQAESLLTQMKTWNFGNGGIFARLDDETVGTAFHEHPLAVCCLHATRDLLCFQNLNIRESHLFEYMLKVEEKYMPRDQVQYHNSIHACDVTQSIYVMLSSLTIEFDPLTKFSCIFAAAIHDIAHPGTNNSFQINTSSKLAIRYNDQSVLENFHVATAFRLLKEEPKLNPLQDLNESDRRFFRDRVVNMVLSTDLSLHFDHLAQFKASSNFEGGLTQPDIDEGLLSNMMLHCADIGSVSKSWDVYRKWISMLFEEFYAQGDKEKSLGLVVAPFMDRHHAETSPPKAQQGFISYIVLPLYEVFTVYMPDLFEELTSNANANLQHLIDWENSPITVSVDTTSNI